MNAFTEREKADVQRVVVYPYVQKRSRHFILEVKYAAHARAFLRRLVKDGIIADASLPEAQAARGCRVNIGFTFRGLERLGLHPAYLRIFQEKAPAFSEGAHRRAARHLADSGASAATGWEAYFDPGRAHVLINLHAERKKDLEAETERLRTLDGADGLTDWKKWLGAKHLPETAGYRTVHFGLRDFISEPAIEGFVPPGTKFKVKPIHQPGEFLLGYRNDDQFNSWLLINPSPSPNPWFPPLARADRNFFRNGSFAALRKMEQDERRFREYLERWAALLGVDCAYLKAKMTGRWANGHLVKPRETKPPATPATGADLDDFDFKEDKEGLGCPFGSHIRRMNPRNDPIAPRRLRPLIRRGMPYGDPYDVKPDPSEKRGLLGLFFCASLEDQFEHLLVHWGHANPMGPANRGDSDDPITGTHGDPRAMFDIPLADEELQQLHDFTRFVTTRGTLYAFFPGLAALSTIAAERRTP